MGKRVALAVLLLAVVLVAAWRVRSAGCGGDEPRKTDPPAGERDPPVDTRRQFRCTGEVVDAATGAPVASALVLLVGNDTPGQPAPRMSDAREYAREWATGELHRAYGYPGDWADRVLGITRTDATGRFRIVAANTRLRTHLGPGSRDVERTYFSALTPGWVFVAFKGYRPTTFKADGATWQEPPPGGLASAFSVGTLRLPSK